MRYYNRLDFNFQNIYVFIVVAEYQSVTKAAEYLYVSPSHISKTVKKLETQWGIQLFVRNKKNISLTPAGKHIYRGLVGNMENIKRVLDEAVQVQKVIPFVRVGGGIGNPLEKRLPSVIGKLKKIHPNISVSIECADSLFRLNKMLLSGELDVIHTVNTAVETMPDHIGWKKLGEMPVYLLINKMHPLAQKEDVGLEDIRHEEFVVMSSPDTVQEDYAIRLCRNHGFEPNICKYVSNIFTQMLEIRVNPQAVCLGYSYDPVVEDQDIRYYRLSHLKWDIGLAYHAGASQIVKDFIACAAALYQVS